MLGRIISMVFVGGHSLRQNAAMIRSRFRKRFVFDPIAFIFLRLGWLILRGRNPYPDGSAISATIQQCGRKWFCSRIYEVDVPELVDNGLAVGVDRNVGQIATSTGELIHGPDLKKLAARKKRYDRVMARRLKGSNRRQKARHLRAKTHRTIANKRKDWCHQTSRVLANTAAEVVIEDLNTRGMTASAKGTIENPGKNVKQKAR